MSASKLWLWTCLLFCLFDVHFWSCSLGVARADDQPWSLALEQFFGSIDEDGDGQIETAEALQYINANFDSLDIQQDSRTAAQQMRKNLDGGDNDATISKKEVEEHLRKLLKGNRVVDWLKHSAQMPQYVQAFRDNSVTSLDFPMLVSDGGATLENDLGIKSKLHREQLMRALKRVILGIGATPSGPLDLQCVPLSCESLALKWKLPERLGSPPLHKYKLERQQTRLPGESVAAPMWVTANGDLDDEEAGWIDAGLKVGEYQYRMTAWNALGWSDYSYLSGCNTADASLPCPPEKCWSEDTCKSLPRPGSFEVGSAAGDARVGWNLLWSLGGMAVVSLLLSTRFWSSEQRQVQVQEYARRLGLGKALSASSTAPQRAAAELETDAPKSVSPTMSAKEHLDSELSRSQASLPDGSLLSGVRGLSSRQLLHLESTNSRFSSKDGASRNSTPRRRSHIHASRNDLFLPNEVETFKGSPECSGVLPNLRIPSRTRSPGMAGEQEVLWLDDEGLEVNPPVLDIPPSPQQASRYGCGFPGCEKRMHPILQPRAALTSHYCSICQNVFCHMHTRYSPHGRLGSCGMESKCICQICHDDLPRQTQERLEKTNKLHIRKDLNPVATEGSGSMKSRRGSSIFSLGRQNLVGPQQESNPPAAGRSSPTGAPGAASFHRNSQPGQKNWSLLRNVWRATRQFQGAGRERSRRSQELKTRWTPQNGGSSS